MTRMFIKELNNKKITVLDKIEEVIFYNKVSYFIQHVLRFLGRLPRWVKLCWTTESWDSGYMYDFFEMQLKELKKAQENDTWHVGKETKRRAKQIDITLQRLDRYRNWTEYYDYPIDDIEHVKVEDEKYGTCYRMVATNPENEKQREGAHRFEQHNYDKFWKDFLDWHQGWWI